MRFVGFSKPRGRPILLNQDKREAAWHDAVRVEALAAMRAIGLWKAPSLPAAVEFHFYLLPHREAPYWLKAWVAQLPDYLHVPHQTKPDPDKMIRSCLDAMSGVAYPDDQHVHAVAAHKWYARCEEEERAEVTVRWVLTCAAPTEEFIAAHQKAPRKKTAARKKNDAG